MILAMSETSKTKTAGYILCEVVALAKPLILILQSQMTAVLSMTLCYTLVFCLMLLCPITVIF